MGTPILRSILLSAIVAVVSQSPSTAQSELLKTWEEARAAFRAQDWNSAAELYGQVARENQTHGAVWQSTAYALLRSGQYEDAVAAYEQAAKSGNPSPNLLYDIACAHALAGRADDAVEALGRAYDSGFVGDGGVRTDTDLSTLHESARFREIVGWEVAGVTDREERWRRDLDFLDRRIRTAHWSPFGVLPEVEYDEALTSISRSIGGRSDLELRADLQKLLARIGDGHTAVVTDFFQMHHGSPKAPAFLPLEVFCFEDAVRIVGTTEAHRDLIGAEVLAIGNRGIGEVTQTVAEHVSSDNEWGAKWSLAQALVDPKLLHGLGLGSVDEGFLFRLQTLDGAESEHVLATGGAEVLHGVRPVESWLKLPETPSRTRKDQHLWLQNLDSSILYVRIDGIRDGHRESFHQFTDRIFHSAEEADAQVLVLDLRDNPGGQGHLARPLFHELISSERFGRPGRLFVLVGRKTFSAAMALAAQLDVHTDAMFVGEPTGSRPNFVGESSLVQLPYSKLWVSISSRYHQNGGSNDRRMWIPPALPAGPTFDDMRMGRDAGLDAIVNVVRSRGD